MSAEDIIQLLLSEENRPMYVTFVDIDKELLEKKLNLSAEKEANPQPRSQPTHVRDYIYTAAVPGKIFYVLFICCTNPVY